MAIHITNTWPCCVLEVGHYWLCLWFRCGAGPMICVTTRITGWPSSLNVCVSVCVNMIFVTCPATYCEHTHSPHPSQQDSSCSGPHLYSHGYLDSQLCSFSIVDCVSMCASIDIQHNMNTHNTFWQYTKVHMSLYTCYYCMSQHGGGSGKERLHSWHELCSPFTWAPHGTINWCSYAVHDCNGQTGAVELISIMTSLNHVLFCELLHPQLWDVCFSKFLQCLPNKQWPYTSGTHVAASLVHCIWSSL